MLTLVGLKNRDKTRVVVLVSWVFYQGCQGCKPRRFASLTTLVRLEEKDKVGREGGKIGYEGSEKEGDKVKTG